MAVVGFVGVASESCEHWLGIFLTSSGLQPMCCSKHILRIKWYGVWLNHNFSIFKKNYESACWLHDLC